MKSLLIIGGTGVLSSAVTREAVTQSYKVSMINRGRRNNVNSDLVEVLKSDKDDYKKIEQLLGSRYFDAVIDFLCYSIDDIRKSYSFYKKYTKQYFFISSCAVYKPTLDVMTEESEKPNQAWDYSLNKWDCEQYLMQFSDDKSTKITIVRPCLTYDDTRIPYGVLPAYGFHWTLIERMLKSKPIITWNHGENRFNMMRVEDFAVGIVGLIKNDNAYSETFNICGEEIHSFDEVLNVLEIITGVKANRIDITSEFYAQEVPGRAGEILGFRSIDSINSIQKIKSVVPGFKQTISIEEGIRKTYNAYKNNNYQKGIDWVFDAQCDRVIKKWCKKQGISTKQYNLGFVDYLGTATPKDKLSYWIEYYGDSLLVKGLKVCFKVFRKVRNVLK